MYETIAEIVSERKWFKKKERLVSEETKRLFEKRAQAFNAKAPTLKERKKWGRKVRNSCRDNYRTGVSSWVQKSKQQTRKETRRKYMRS